MRRKTQAQRFVVIGLHSKAHLAKLAADRASALAASIKATLYADDDDCEVFTMVERWQREAFGLQLALENLRNDEAAIALEMARAKREADVAEEASAAERKRRKRK